ncbi:MAG: thioredoxin [Desulfatirhabdiaceae bacterium]
MSEHVLEIKDDQFENDVLKGTGPVLVDFWAPWCGPCRAIGPIVEELAEKFGNQMKFFKCNVDESPVTPQKYGIRSIPTLIFFKNGEVANQVVGAVAKSKLEEMINSVIG